MRLFSEEGLPKTIKIRILSILIEFLVLMQIVDISALEFNTVGQLMNKKYNCQVSSKHRGGFTLHTFRPCKKIINWKKSNIEIPRCRGMQNIED